MVIYYSYEHIMDFIRGWGLIKCGMHEIKKGACHAFFMLTPDTIFNPNQLSIPIVMLIYSVWFAVLILVALRYPFGLNVAYNMHILRFFSFHWLCIMIVLCFFSNVRLFRVVTCGVSVTIKNF